MPHPDRLHIESLLAQAHRRIWLAAQVAESFATDDLNEDLMSLLGELEAMQVALLRGHAGGRKGRRGRAYLSESPPDDRSPAT